MSHKHDNTRKQKRMQRLIILVAVLLVLAGGALLASRLTDQADTQESQSASRHVLETEIDGIRCQAKTRIKTYLIMGIDATGKAHSEEEDADASGQCDTLHLYVIDQIADTNTLLPINRNTITAVNSLDDNGEVVATTDVQIALAHANGDGYETSCENTVEAVSNLLYGIKIDGYMALNIDSILIMNDLVGGVEVTIEDDFSQEDPTLVMGETIKLQGEQAEHFVRGRMNVADGTNENRMKRQAQFLEALFPTFISKCEGNEEFAIEVFNTMSDYMVTDMSGKDFSKMVKAIIKNEELESPEITGSIGIDRWEFATFEPDQDSIRDAVIQLYYERL